MRNRPLIACIAVLLSACATTPQTEGPYPDTIMPRCSVGPDCTAKWQAAIEFVKQNAQMQIINLNDTVIETDVASFGNGPIAMRVTKEPDGNGRYKLRAIATCPSRRCLKEPWMIVAAFNLKIGGVANQPAP